MKARNLVLGLLLATNVLTAQSAVFSATLASSSKNTEMVNMTTAVSSAVINSQNNAIIDCILNYERVKKDGDLFGHDVPSLEKTVNSRRCRLNKNTMEQFNNTHYEFGKVKGIFSIKGTEHVMIELVEINE